MSSIPEEDVHTTSLLARQVFLVAIPSLTAHDSEAKEAKDIPAASADDKEKEDHEVISLTIDLVVQEEVLVQDPQSLKPLKLRQMRLPPPPLMKPMTLSWLKIMCNPKSIMPWKTMHSHTPRMWMFLPVCLTPWNARSIMVRMLLSGGQS